MKALVVDDSKAMRTILSGILSGIGFDVFEAENGLVALERMKEVSNLALAQVDWNMPEMNGYEFVQAVRALDDYNSTKLMMVTTETEMVQVAKALEAGADEYVMKPFTKDVIMEKLNMLGISFD